MNYNEFQETLLKELESRLDSHISLNPITTTKNNNTLKHGIEFYNDTSNISPVLYLDEWYEFYLTGKSLSQIAEDIVELYHQATNVSFTDTEMLLDYEKLEEKILYKLVNFKANQSLLKDIPHIPYLDLAIVFYVLLDCKDSRMATVLIRNEHLKTWGKDLNTVFSDARKNTPRVFPAELTPMSDFLQNTIPNSNEFIDPDRDCVMKSELFILSNAIRQHGAICTLYDDIMNQIGKTLQDDFFVIPSSVHEVLLLKASDTDCMELNEIIREVNETTVIPEEILSDHAYFYSRDRKELLCA